MVCPVCGAERPRVGKVNPDGKRDPRRTYRRRYCLACGCRFRTVEIIDHGNPNHGQPRGSPWRNRAAARNGRGDHPPTKPPGPPPSVNVSGAENLKSAPARIQDFDRAKTPAEIARELAADPLG
jgi:hypothetical protein